MSGGCRWALDLGGGSYELVPGAHGACHGCVEALHSFDGFGKRLSCIIILSHWYVQLFKNDNLDFNLFL